MSSSCIELTDITIIGDSKAKIMILVYPFALEGMLKYNAQFSVIVNLRQARIGLRVHVLLKRFWSLWNSTEISC